MAPKILFIAAFLMSGCSWLTDDDESSSDGSGQPYTGSSGGSSASGNPVTLRPSCQMLGAVVGNRILIAGGSSGELTTFGSESASDESTDEVQLASELAVFDVIAEGEIVYSPRWSKLLLPESRRGFAMVTSGSRVFIAGGQRTLGASAEGIANYASLKSDRVDVYDHDAKAFTSTMHLSSARSQLAAAAAGPFVLFAGGDNGAVGPSGELCNGNECYFRSTRIDIYDTVNDVWTTAELPHFAVSISGASAGDKAVFNLDGRELLIFDSLSQAWATVPLPSFAAHNRARPNAAMTVHDGRIYIAGDNADMFDTYDLLEIFDIAAGTWQETRLPLTRSKLAATVAGGRLVIAGGRNDYFSFSGGSLFPDEVEILEIATGNLTRTTLAAGRDRLLGATVGGRFAVFAGGLGGASGVDAKGQVTAAVEVLDTADGVWYHGNGMRRETPSIVERPPVLDRGSRALYIPVTADDALHAYQIDDDDGSLNLIDTYQVGNGPMGTAWDFASGQFLYVANSGSASVSGFRIATDGSLTEITGSPFSVRETPIGLTFTSTVLPIYAAAYAGILYVSSESSKALAGYRIDPETGALTELTNPVNPLSLREPSHRVAHSVDRRLLYVPDGDTIGTMIITRSDGYLTGSFISTGLASEPFDLLPHPTLPILYATSQGPLRRILILPLDPYSGRPLVSLSTSVESVSGAVTAGATFGASGAYAYFGGLGTTEVIGFAVDAETGALTPLPASPFTVASKVETIASDPSGAFLYVFHADSISIHAINKDDGSLAPSVDGPATAGGLGISSFAVLGD